MLEMLMITPPLRLSIMCAAASRPQRKTPLPPSPDEIEFLEAALKTEGAPTAAGLLVQVRPATKAMELLPSSNRRVRSEGRRGLQPIR
jgi:hypothetical protein